MITIGEQWRIVDQWWTSTPINRSFAEVIWDGRMYIFKRELPDKVWRIIGVINTETAPDESSEPT